MSQLFPKQPCADSLLCHKHTLHFIIITPLGTLAEIYFPTPRAIYRSDISDMCRDMQEYPQKHKENQQKNEQNPHTPPSAGGALRAPCVDFVHFFVDFP